MIYLDYEVLLTKPNWDEAGAMGFKNSFELLRYMGIGIISSHRQESEIRYSANFTCIGRQAIQEIERFFESKCGKWSNFWIPSWQKDIVVTNGFLFGATSLEIEDIEYPDTWLYHEITGRHLFMLWSDGHVFNVEVTDAPNNTTLTLGTGVDRACTLAGLKDLFVCFLYWKSVV